MLSPRRHVGEEVGEGGNRYRLTKFVRVQGDKPHPERFRIEPVFFTPALRHSWSTLFKISPLHIHIFRLKTQYGDIQLLSANHLLWHLPNLISSLNRSQGHRVHMRLVISSLLRRVQPTRSLPLKRTHALIARGAAVRPFNYQIQCPAQCSVHGVCKSAPTVEHTEKFGARHVSP